MSEPSSADLPTDLQTAEGDLVTHPEQEQDEERVDERALLLPEEIAAGSDDPEAQAEAVLADSDEREAGVEGSDWQP